MPNLFLLYDMMMDAFYKAILLESVGVGHSMRDSCFVGNICGDYDTRPPNQIERF